MHLHEPKSVRLQKEQKRHSNSCCTEFDVAKATGFQSHPCTHNIGFNWVYSDLWPAWPLWFVSATRLKPDEGTPELADGRVRVRLDSDGSIHDVSQYEIEKVNYSTLLTIEYTNMTLRYVPQFGSVRGKTSNYFFLIWIKLWSTEQITALFKFSYSHNCLKEKIDLD